MSEQELELPKGWVETILGDIITSAKGKKPKTLGKKTSKNKFPYINIKAFEKKIFDEYTDDESCPRCTENDLLMVWDGSRSGLVGYDVSGVIGSTLVKLDCNGNDTKFLWYFLQSKYQTLNTKQRGSGTPHVNPDILWNFKFLLPSLNEQKRIVSKIEELFSKIDSTKQSLEHTKLQLEQYRRSLLKSAFEGKLTEKWREGNPEIDSNIRWDLSVNPINSENLPKIPPQWCWRKLEQISNGVVVSFVGSTSKHYVEENYGVMFLRSQNVRKGKINFKGLKYVDKDFHKKEKKSQIKPGYLLIVRVGANRGDTCIVPDSIPAANAGNIIIARVFEDISPLLNYYFQTDFSQKQLIGMTTGSAQGVINTTSVSKVLIPIPSLEEQKEIIARIEQGFSLIENTQNIVNSTLQTLQTMKMSVLKQAFEGKLVPQDPNDEPAQILLEKIKSTKEAQPAKKRRAKNVK